MLTPIVVNRSLAISPSHHAPLDHRYVAGGVYIQRKRGETGFDSMPNRSFWAAMPGLIKVSLPPRSCRPAATVVAFELHLATATFGVKGYFLETAKQFGTQRVHLEPQLHFCRLFLLLDLRWP